MTSPLSKPVESGKAVKRSLLFIHLSWLCLILGLLGWSLWRDNLQIDRLVEREALVRLKSANNIRRWIVGFGGVYAPVSEAHRPNPLIPVSVGRDIETRDGLQLTIANSISALTHIMGKDNRVEGGFIRFTGPEPLKPENAPDPWETAAIKRLADGETLAGGFTELEGKPYYRLMQPLLLKPKCYKCHQYTSFQLGDIVGGLGVNVDLAVYSGLRQEVLTSHFLNYLGIWAVGALGITFAGRRWQGFLREKDAYNQRLQELATHDQLTGFLNRHQLDVIFDHELARAKRQKTPLSILMVDIDNFKTINDRHGHPIGDKVLQSIAGDLEKTLRASDYVIRYGGDELLFLLPESDHRQSLKKAEAIRCRILAHTVAVNETDSVRITLSIGAATYPDHGLGQKELVQVADKAVYRAKHEGRNRTCSAASVS